MQKIGIAAIAIGAGFSGIAGAGVADRPDKAGCSTWPWASLRAPCGASFRGRARSGNDRGEGGEFEIVRAGEWQRERSAGPPERLIYVHYASGTSIAIGHDAAGQPTFSISQDFRDPRSQLKKTDETIAYLGENCRVWITTESHTGLGMEHQDCLTADGVPLLHDYAPGKSGTLGEKLAAGKPIMARATHIERVAVRQNEVRPPASLFRWSSWGVVAGRLEAGATNYEVRLEDKGDIISRRVASAITIRRLAQSELAVERKAGAVRVMNYRDPNRIAEFFAFDDGRPRSLSIYSTSGTRAAVLARRDSRMSQPAPLDEKETILGEECRWYDMSPGMQDASEEDCRTDDGIPLARRKTSWGATSLVARATFLRRGGLRSEDLLPPDELIGTELWLRPRSPS